MRKPVLCALVVAVALNFPLTACCPLSLCRVALPTSDSSPSEPIGPQIPSVGPDASSTPERPSTAEAFVSTYGVAAAVTDNDKYAAIAVHESGEKLVAMTDVDASGTVSRVSGAIWISPEDEALVVYSGPDGLPDRAVIGDVVLLFSNYTRDAVDVAVVVGDGSVQIIRDTPVDPDDLAELRTLQARISGRPGSPGLSKPAVGTMRFSVASTLKIAALLLRLVGCALKVMHAMALPPALILAVLPCTSALISLVDVLIDSELLTATGLYLDKVACIDMPPPLRDPVACAALILDMAGAAVSEAEEKSRTEMQTMEEARTELESGPRPTTLTPTHTGTPTSTPSPTPSVTPTWTPTATSTRVAEALPEPPTIETERPSECLAPDPLIANSVVVSPDEGPYHATVRVTGWGVEPGCVQVLELCDYGSLATIATAQAGVDCTFSTTVTLSCDRGNYSWIVVTSCGAPIPTADWLLTTLGTWDGWAYSLYSYF